MIYCDDHPFLITIKKGASFSISSCPPGDPGVGIFPKKMTCCPLRNPSTGLPLFGISLLTPGSLPAQPSSLHPLLNFLGLSDQELQDQIKKGHSYAFNMGNNNIIPFSDFHSAARALMERNMPEVLHNRQTKAEFLPETHLPNMPRVVDEQEYQTRKEQLDSSTLQLLGMKQGTEDSQVAQGDLC